MKTATVLQFPDLINLGRYIKVIHASSYRIDTSKMTVKACLSSFEIGIATEQYKAKVVEQLERV